MLLALTALLQRVLLSELHWILLLLRTTLVLVIDIVLLVVDGSIRELKTKDIISIKSISLKSVNHNRCLQSGFEVGKTENDFLVGFFLTGNQPYSFEAREGSENMRNFSLLCIKRDSLNIYSACGIRGNRHNA